MKKYIVSFFVIATFITYVVYARLVGTSPAPIIADQAQTPTSTPVSTPPKTLGMYKDGTYVGPVVDVYYGNLQVEATIQDSRLADVQLLQYPNDRSTSVEINTRALKTWKSEAISAQAATTNIVSGATDSSEGFNKSLATALAQAKN